jgi:hypothetical protein
MNYEDNSENDSQSHNSWLHSAIMQDVYKNTHPAAEHCSCRGYGWILSDYDTWHECRFHKGLPHPEAPDDFDYEKETK